MWRRCLEAVLKVLGGCVEGAQRLCEGGGVCANVVEVVVEAVPKVLLR